MPTPVPVGEASGQVFIHALALVAGLLGLVGLVPTTIRLDYDTSSTLAMAYVAVRLSFTGCLSCLNYTPANIASPGMLGHRRQRLGDRCVGVWYEKQQSTQAPVARLPYSVTCSGNGLGDRRWHADAVHGIQSRDRRACVG